MDIDSTVVSHREKIEPKRISDYGINTHSGIPMGRHPQRGQGSDESRERRF